ncbi:unnamed protein product [Effrenium voratum]|uniref:BTB domain-containing protein n=1 Tax=Effrenium voratum TaxID=2562239 RepID=A0AA36NBA5_9DINO|nr:unnamed protein product [Effrenium voratum]CAJ1421289.1 unnamed protein product [Effrenium voratum]
MDSQEEAVVKLNVGGVVYTTSKSTLLSCEGMLEKMFNGSLSNTKIDGAYFIDRDGHLFRYVLEYLRNRSVQLPDSHQVRQRLLQEANFFSLGGLCEELQVKLLQREVRVEVFVERFMCSEEACKCGAGQKIEISALEGLAFFDLELSYPRREQRPDWTSPSAALRITLQQSPEQAREDSLKRALTQLRSALVASEVSEQSAEEIVSEATSPVRNVLNEIAQHPELVYLDCFARADEYKVGDRFDVGTQYVHYAKCVKMTFASDTQRCEQA